MEKYIEKALLSIINQSFQDFEIILVNDNSNDDTEEIIRRLQKEFKKIKIINHNTNFGVYCSRVDASLNSNGKYILFMDPDDMLINPYLFEELFKYHLKYNLDMIEFTVYHNKEGEKKIFFPIFHHFNHYHNFKKAIIYQPELSKILFYIPNTQNYTSLICRTIWNKLIRKAILNFTLKYVEKFFHNIYLITADDTALNILNFHFANNYSNINIPGYLYNIRNNSMSRINNQKKHDIMVSYNYLLYFNFFYNYLKEFKKDLNILLYDLKLGFHVLFTFRKLNETKYIKKTINFFYKINKENISLNFKKFIKSSIFKIRQ
jgi:glycosyltransferase involved in cell wall biosynthesis